jgi:hypothetical protein
MGATTNRPGYTPPLHYDAERSAGPLWPTASFTVASPKLSFASPASSTKLSLPSPPSSGLTFPPSLRRCGLQQQAAIASILGFVLASMVQGLTLAFQSCWSLHSRRRRVQGTASKRDRPIGCPHSSRVPNLPCRIRAKASSMARKSLLSVCFTWTCMAALVSLAAISTGSPANFTWRGKRSDQSLAGGETSLLCKEKILVVKKIALVHDCGPVSDIRSK